MEQLEREGVFVFPEIVRAAEDITQDQMILQSINETFRTSNVMGFIGCGDERLIIESRFCGDGEDYFFQYLLERVLDFPNIVDLETDANQNNRLFNFLLFLFPHYLNRDYLQVLAYMFRFDAKSGYYLYPEAGNTDDLRLRMNRGSTYESDVRPREDISITKQGLKIPTDATDYDGFVAKMKLAEREFMSVL